MNSYLPRNHEDEAIKAFVIREKRERFLYLLENPSRRRKFIIELGHFRWWDRRYVTAVPWNPDPSLSLWERRMDGVKKIVKLLQSKGAAQTCWVISQDSECDSREMALEEALEETIDGDSAAILSCIPGKLAYFKNEAESLLLWR